MQTRPSHPIRDIDVGHLGDDQFHAPGGVVGGSHVGRRLPVLVPCALVRAFAQEQLNHSLKSQQEDWHNVEETQK